MSCSKLLLSLVSVVGLLCTGCGQLPKPFKSELGGGAESPLVAMQEAIGVVVAPIVGSPPGVAGLLSGIMAAGLRRANVPATTASEVKNAFLLEGKAVIVPATGDKIVVNINWTITNVAGNVVKQLKTSSLVHGRAWQAANRAPLNTVSSDAVPRISDALQKNYFAVLQQERPTVAVVAVEGAPGDGNEALKKAFVAVLKNGGLPVVADPDNASIQIFGKVDITDQASGHEKLEIDWYLLGMDGSEIGKMTQSNTIKKGRLISKWGPLAYDVTFAMVDSVADVLLSLDRRRDFRQD